MPLVAALLPQRAQAAMISRSRWPAGFDPYKLDNELRSMVVSHGGTYVDILPDFRNIVSRVSFRSMSIPMLVRTL